MEVCRFLLKEIIPQFGLPESLQSDNGPSFRAQITEGLTTALGTDYKLHISWHPQSSGKVEKMNHTLKKTSAKLYQETHEPWTSLLPIVLLRVCVAPKNGLRLSPFEMTSHRPFLTIDILSEEEMSQTEQFIINLRQIQMAMPTNHCKILLKTNKQTKQNNGRCSPFTN